MTESQLRDSYQKRKERFIARVRHHNRVMAVLGLFRLLSLVLLGWFIVVAVRNDAPWFYPAAGLTGVVFLVLVSRFNRQKDLRRLNSRLRDLNQRELDCLAHDFRSQPDGREFADPAHPWSHDLDLFGSGSLYQYLNRTASSKGSKFLAGLLCTEAEGPGQIGRRQKIIHELKNLTDFRQTYVARGEMFEDEPDAIAGIENWLNTPAYITPRPWLFYIALLMTCISLGILTLAIAGQDALRYMLLVLVFNFSLLSPFIARTNSYQQNISKRQELLKGYSLLLGLITENNFLNEDLKLRVEISMGGVKEVRRLSRLVSFFDQRLNMLLGAVFNGLFLYDFIMMYLLERWKRRNREKILEWMEITAWMDAYISLSGFAYNHPDYCMPEFSSGMDLKEAGHPLIPPEKRVCNDLEAGKEKVVIITGANMAGKSTFLRSLGVNMVLAYTGCPVCASKFKLDHMGLFSSMRTADSLADEESYFLAEIKRLQRIVEDMESGRPILILLDEVLKGTNTTDKKKGSVGLIRRCLTHPVHCIIATHDLSLGELEAAHEGQVVNYCFESYIKDLELSFDYRIQKGIACNMNASFLMKKMGIMD